MTYGFTLKMTKYLKALHRGYRECSSHVNVILFLINHINNKFVRFSQTKSMLIIVYAPLKLILDRLTF